MHNCANFTVCSWPAVADINSFLYSQTALLSAAIFGNVSSIMLRLYQGSDEYHEKIESVKEFVNFHHIPKTLANRLQESFQHNWSYTNGIDMNNVR